MHGSRHYWFQTKFTFPADDELAVEVARLVILEQDVNLEIIGMNTEVGLTKIDAAPEVDRVYLTMFMFRSALVTLDTARDCLNAIRRFIREGRLRADEEAERRIVEVLDGLTKLLSTNPGLGDARNVVGGHLDVGPVKGMLNGLGPDEVGKFVVSGRLIHNEHPFARRFLEGALSQPLGNSKRPHFDMDALISATLHCAFAFSHVACEVIGLYLAQRRVPAV